MLTKEQRMATWITARDSMLTQEFLDQAYSLVSRWEDEKEYEDIADYQTVMKRIVPTTVTLVKMTKRPFGFIFKVDGLTETFQCKLPLSGRATVGVRK